MHMKVRHIDSSFSSTMNDNIMFICLVCPLKITNLFDLQTYLILLSALTKSVGLLADGRFDDRSYWINRAFILSTALCVPLVYPRMIAIQDLASMVCKCRHRFIFGL